MPWLGQREHDLFGLPSVPSCQRRQRYEELRQKRDLGIFKSGFEFALFKIYLPDVTILVRWVQFKQ